jgi:hypothetical protein
MTLLPFTNPKALNLSSLPAHQREQAICILGQINQTWMMIGNLTRDLSRYTSDLSQVIGNHPMLDEMTHNLEGMSRTVRNLQQDPFS